jgi:Lon protease-like protein
MSDQLENLKAEDVSIGEKPLSIPPELPILPLRDTVLFPNSFMPLAVARESSVRLIDDAIANGKLIAVFTQRDAAVEEPGQDDLYPVGTATHIHKMFKLPDGSLRLIVQGLARLKLDQVIDTQPYLRARVTAATEDTNDADRLEIDALARNIKTNFQQVVSLSPLLSDDLQTLAVNITEPGRLADFIASSLSTIGTAVKQDVLETLDIRTRMDNLNRILIKELEVLELGSKIQSQVQSEVGKNQREYFLREQMKAIQKELGEGDDQTKEIEELNEKIEAAGMPEGVKKGSAPRAGPVVEDAGRRRRVHRLANLPRLARGAALEQADRRSHRSAEDQADAGSRPFRTREGQGSHPGIPGGPEAEPGGQGTDPLLRGSSWRRQDVAGALDRRVARPQVRARVAGRHA